MTRIGVIIMALAVTNLATSGDLPDPTALPIKADIDRWLASRASHQLDGFAAVTTDSGTSSDLDLETIFHAEGSSVTAEMEAMSVKNLMESNGIAAVLMGDSVLPNFPFEVKVAREQAARARKLLEDIESVGPEAAEELEAESEKKPRR